MVIPRTVQNYTNMVLLFHLEHANLAMFHMKQLSNSKKGENMELTITEARQTIVDLVSAFNTYLTPSERTALAMADQALKTIEDMKGETKHDNI